MTKPSKTLIGYSQLTFAQIWLALNIILGKFLAPVFPIFSLLALRFTLGFVLIAFYLILTYAQESKAELKSLQKRDWIILGLQALCGGFLFNALTLYGLQFATATSAGIINSTIPAFVALFSFLILKEVLTKRTVFSILLTVVGILTMTAGKTTLSFSTDELFGICILFLAIMPASLFTIFAKMTKVSFNPLLTTAMVNFINIFLFVPFALQENHSALLDASTASWVNIVMYSISGSVFFFFFWFKGLKHVPANLSALFIALTPVFTAVFAAMLLNERLSWFDLIGMLCVLGSLVIGTLQPKQPTTKHKVA